MREFRVAKGATEILLVRHANAEHSQPETALEIKEIDLPLTAAGQEQAQRLAHRLVARKPSAVYASPLKRAMETAEPIAQALALEIRRDERLREVEIGNVGSVSLSDLAEIAIAHGGWSHLPQTEASAAIRTRMREAIDSIVAAHPAERIVVVSHAGAINAYLAALLNLEKDFFFPAGNTSITVLRAHGDKRLLVTLNDTAHLEGLK